MGTNFLPRLLAMAALNFGNKNFKLIHVHKKFFVVFTSFSNKDKLLINYSTFMKTKIKGIFS